MRVSRGKASVSGDITVSEDLDFLTTWKVLRLATPTSGGALRKGNKDITHLEISNTAAITRAMLNLGDGLVNADIATGAAILLSKIVNTYLLPTIMTTQGDIVVRGAVHPARFAKPTTGQLLRATATGYEGVAMPAPLTVAETEVYTGAAPTTFTDLDLSAVVGSNYALVILKVSSSSSGRVAFRKNGDTDDLYEPSGAGAHIAYSGSSGEHLMIICPTDDAGILEWIKDDTDNITIDVVAYVK